MRYTLPMAVSEESDLLSRRMVAAWGETGRLLRERRLAELSSQSARESQEAAFDMLQLAGMLPDDPRRERKSGLIEMQRLFARWHARGPA
jgi:hypothetical protein